MALAATVRLRRSMLDHRVHRYNMDPWEAALDVRRDHPRRRWILFRVGDGECVAEVGSLPEAEEAIRDYSESWYEAPEVEAEGQGLA